jgi:TRAP-type C4-dicarboxylate transport system substrate-binding protein
MKTLMIAIAFVGATATASAFAQSAPSSTQQAVATTQVALNSTSSNGEADQWASSSAEASGGKTRAQVYQELVHSEQDGQLNQLTATIYSH